MSTADPTSLPDEVGTALRKLITVCAKHDIPIGQLLMAPDQRRIMHLELRLGQLTNDMAKANTELIKLRRKVADYEEI